MKNKIIHLDQDKNKVVIDHTANKSVTPQIICGENMPLSEISLFLKQTAQLLDAQLRPENLAHVCKQFDVWVQKLEPELVTKLQTELSKIHLTKNTTADIRVGYSLGEASSMNISFRLSHAKLGVANATSINQVFKNLIALASDDTLTKCEVAFDHMVKYPDTVIVAVQPFITIEQFVVGTLFLRTNNYKPQPDRLATT